ncbi:MAG: two component AraC family transcriptional regulator [Paenibacillus sp.]|jgi:YesN/AraC family two-component response regulator|nr:two component AraC family transcriptional regulator [Paenibacillus sp.]
MYKVLIVDDEPWVLKGIRSTFNWDNLGFQVIAETTDSLEALDIILRQKPDVILTDIRMPELSGIDLMKQCRLRGIRSEFIIISGASDFHYAQESIRLGCFDYLLKPLQFDEANALLERLLRHLDKVSHQKDLDFLEALHHADGAVMKQLLNSRGILSGLYQIIYLTAATKEQLDQASEWIMDEEHIIIKADPNKMLVILGCKEDIYPRLAANFETALLRVKDRLFIGVSEPSPVCEEIPRLIEEAHFAMHSSFVHLTGGVFMQSKEIHPAVRKTVQAVCTAVHHHSPERLSSLLNEVPEQFREAGAGMKEVVYFWNQVISTFNNQYNDRAAHDELSFMDYGGLVNKFTGLEELVESLKHFMVTGAEAAGPVIAEPDQLVNENFKELLEFVNRHFEEELHLRELSNKFFINYTYCCDLFQKTAKVTFTDYVTRLRMKKAGQLLRESDLTITEICREAGYKDYHYFNKVFKKSYGVTPSNYRKSQTAPH